MYSIVRYFFFVFVVLNLLFTKTSFAAPEVTVEYLRSYLHAKGSPMEDAVDSLFNEGEKTDIDPRLIIAIAGAESSFGRSACTPFNAWNWFYTRLGCDNICAFCNAPYDSYGQAAHGVAVGLRMTYMDFYHLYTIDAIQKRYCVSEKQVGGETIPDCPIWRKRVKEFYQEMGGCLEDLSFGEPDPGKCTKSKPPEQSCSLSTLANVHFGDVRVGECSDVVLVPMQSGAGCKKNTVTISTFSPFTVLSSESLTLQGIESKNIQVRFCPTAIENAHGQLVIAGEHAPQPVELHGNGIDPTINPDSHCFFDTSGNPWDGWHCAKLFNSDRGFCAKEVYLPMISPETGCDLARATFPEGVDYYPSRCPAPQCGPFVKDCVYERFFGDSPMENVPCN